MEFIVRKGGDVMDVNVMEFIHLNVHPWFVLNLYIHFSILSILSQPWVKSQLNSKLIPS
jgi:hypothetical protein